MARQTRDEIMTKLEAAPPQRMPDGFSYQYLLLELILDVLVDLRDSLDSVDNNVNRMDDRQRGL